MVLPLYLAMAAEEMAACPALPPHWGWMACHFSPDTPGLMDLPESLPPGAMLILSDRFPCRNHDPVQIAVELAAATERLGCGSVLLDFERAPAPDSIAVAKTLFQTLPCPVAAPPGFIEASDSAVFLPPCPLHIPLAEYLRPWQGREIWLEAAMQQEFITVTRDGTNYTSAAPTDRQPGGWFDAILQCQCISEISENAVSFTLFDTPETLLQKLDNAAKLGVSKTVGLYQELNEKL